jgi:hypothetical protein
VTGGHTNVKSLEFRDIAILSPTMQHDTATFMNRFLPESLFTVVFADVLTRPQSVEHPIWLCNWYETFSDLL